MSSVDDRIVEMQFNNQRFEKNAKQSMSTLDKLKEKLKFKSSTNELREFQNAADSFDLGHIARAVDAIGDKFTLLGNIGQKAMQRIADAAINAGMTLARSIVVDPVSAGMQKYEEETNAVQVLYHALKPKGYSLETIYDELGRLRDYSDMTSYSYTQMTNGVSVFVAAGRDLKESATAMMGISNAAASAGVSIGNAAIAYRNYSDAISKGKMTREDWKSLQLIHMDTEEIRNEFIKSAKEMGKLDKDGNLVVGTGKKKKKIKIDTKNFVDTLQYGWLDSDVMIHTMERYADTTTEVGAAAYQAAKEAKTFTDVMDSLKDAASTGWATTWKIIFGDLNEAVEFMTELADAIIEVINRVDEFRNTMLTSWKGLGGRDSMIGTLRNIWSIVTRFGEMFNLGFMDALMPTYNEVDKMQVWGGFWQYMGQHLYNFTKRIEDASKALHLWLNGKNTDDGLIRAYEFRSIFAGLVSIFRIFLTVGSGVYRFFKEIFNQLKPAFDAILSLFKIVGDDILGLNKDLRRQDGFTELAKNLAAMFIPLTSRLPKIINWIKDLYGRVKKFWNENKRFVAFRKSVERLFNSIIKFVPRAIETLIGFGKSILETIKNSDEWKRIVKNYNKYIKPLIGIIVDGATRFNNALSDFFNMDTSDEKTLWGKIKKRFSAFDQLGPWLAEKWEQAKKYIPWLQDIEDWWNTDPVINEIKEWVSKIAHAVDIFLSEDTSGETSIIGKIKKRFDAMWNELGPWLSSKWKEYKTKWPFLQQMEDFLGGLFGWGKKAEEGAKEDSEEAGQAVSWLQQLWDKVVEFVNSIDIGKLALAAIAITVLVNLYKVIKQLVGWASIGDAVADAIGTLEDIFKQIKKVVKKVKMLSNVLALVGVATAIWLLGDTLDKLAKLTWPEIGIGLAAMAATMLLFGGFIFALNKLNKGKEWNLPGIMSMVGIGVAMWLLGKTLEGLSELGWDKMWVGITAMALLFTETGAFTILVNRLGTVQTMSEKGIFKGGLSGFKLIGLAIAMWLLGKTLESIGELGWDKMWIGISALGLLFAETGLFTVLVSRLGTVQLLSEKGIFKGGLSGFKLIALAFAMWLLGKELENIGNLGWDKMWTGITAMGLLFAGTGAFTVLVNRLGAVQILSEKGIFKGGLSGFKLIGVAIAIYALGNLLEKLSKLEWDEILKGLGSIGGVFLLLGSFIGILGWLNKKGKIDVNSVQGTLGILAGGIGMMGDAVAKLGKLSVKEIIKGIAALAAIEVLFGLFIGIMGKYSDKINKLNLKTMAGMVVMAGAIWIMAQAFVPLASLSLDQAKVGILALVVIAGALALFCYVMGGMEIKIKSTLGAIISAIALAALMIAFAFALTLIKDVNPQLVLAFSEAMVLVAGAVAILGKVLESFSSMSIGAAVKGAAIMVIAAAALAAAVAIIVTIVGMAVENFSQKIAVVGANLAQYSEQVEGINMEAVNNSITMLKDLSAAFVIIGARTYGDISAFRTNLSRMGASLKLFGLNTADLNTEQMKTVTSAIKDMASDLSGLTEVSDLSTTIGNIAGAIKLYGESLNGVDLSNAPDATAIQTVFNSLKGALPSDEDMTSIAGYATEDKGSQMTNFAIGLTNIATAVSSFSETAKELNFENINNAISALTAITSLNTGLSTTSIAFFGPFAIEMTTQKENLSTFAEDIVNLGTALQAFGTNIASVSVKDLNSGVTVLRSVVRVNKALPKTGGISSWISGSQDLSKFATNLRLLGSGAKAFGESIGESTTFNAKQVEAAGTALVKIAEVNNLLPETGGIKSWFTGDQSLSGFAGSLKKLGEGVAAFVTGLGSSKITDDTNAAVDFVERVVGMQLKLSDSKSWYKMDNYGEELKNMAGSFVEMNNKLTGVTWNDTTQLEHLIDFATSQQVKLGDTKYNKNLKDIGVNLKDFFNEIWNFTKKGGLFDADADTGRLQKVTDAVVSIFTTLNETFANTSAENGDFFTGGENIVVAFISGLESDNSKTKLTNTANSICKKIVDAVKAYEVGFRNAGMYIPMGLGKGIWANRYAAINAAVRVMTASIQAAEQTAGIESPSKEFARIGMYSDLGLAEGLLGYIHVVDNAAGEVSQSALDTVLQDMQDIYNLPLDDLDVQPRIRPVLDTSDISSRAGAIDGLLGGVRSIGLDTRDIEAKAQLLGESTNSDIGIITQQMTALKDQLAQLENTMSHIKMVVDTGALVGAMESDIDRALGARARRGERGN